MAIERVTDNEKEWSIRGGQFEPKLHLPSAAVIEAAFDVEKHLPPDARRRVAAAGVLMSIIQLLQPELAGDPSAMKQMSQDVGREITDAGRYTDQQKQELGQYYAQLGVEPSAATEAIGMLAQEGLDPEISNLVHNAILVMSLKEKITETGADIKLPSARIIKD